MYLPIVPVTALILMIVEIVICCNCPKKSWQAVLPTLVSLSTVFMWVFFFVRPVFITYILGIICIAWTAGVFLGWGLFSAWRWMQNRKQ